MTGPANDAGRKYPENDLLAGPAVRVAVGLRDADIIGNDNRAGEVRMAGNMIKAENQLSDEWRK